MRDKFAGLALLFVIAFLLLTGSTPLAAQTNPAILPTGLDFGYVPTGASATQVVSVYNVSGGKSLTLNSITPSISQLQVVSGTLPITLSPMTHADYTIQFTADTVKSHNGHLTFAIAGQPNQVVNTTGVGTSATAIPSLSATSMSFPDQSLGTTSHAQTLTITNVGTTAFAVTNVVVTYPFAQTGWTNSKSIAPGGSLKLSIGYIPTAHTSQPGLISFTYDVAAPNGVSLMGNGVSPTVMGINTFPTLPSATQNYPYRATLNAIGGTPPYSWVVATGSVLPAGLSLSTSGLITGSIASTVAVGNYTFTLHVQDSSPVKQKGSKLFTLPVGAYSGYKNGSAEPAGMSA